MRPIALIMACVTPLAIGGLVYVAYDQTPQPQRRTAEALSVANMPMPAVAPPMASIAYDVAPPPIAEAPGDAAAAVAPLAVSVPKIAYSYRYAFTLPAARIAPALAAHVEACDRLGPARCQLVAMNSGEGDDTITTATLKLRVASGIARRFGADLERSVGRAGGRAARRSITAEDVSKDVSDTEARLRQRALLVARLTEVLRTRRGSVAELVEAERSVAAAQEEIDQAKSWLGELQGRLAMSTIDIDYSAVAVTAAPAEPSGLGHTLAASLGKFTGAMGALLTALLYLLPWGALLTALLYLLPWGALLYLLWWIVGRLRPDWTRIGRDDPARAEPAPS